MADENWLIWRLVFSDGGITYSDTCKMGWEEILEANAALDLYIERLPKPPAIKGK